VSCLEERKQLNEESEEQHTQYTEQLKLQLERELERKVERDQQKPYVLVNKWEKVNLIPQHVQNVRLRNVEVIGN